MAEVVSMVGKAAKKSSVPVKDRVSPEEWIARTECAALYRLIAHFKMTDFIANHISLRVPGTEESFLINPYGYLYEEITASSLVRVNVAGDVLDDPVGLGVNRAGYVIHGAVHAARHDVACVIHTHTKAGIAVSAQEGGLLPISQHAAIVWPVSYHAYEGIAIDTGEQARLVKDLGSTYSMILENHGLLALGRNAGEAFFTMIMLERACEAQIAALAGGAKVRHMTPEALQAANACITGMEGDFWRDWAAALRLADRIGPDYKT